MKILLVDDQKEIVDSLKKGIRWGSLPVDQVYTACSAKEAKLILLNFDVDVLITDIEMPEEDGLSLFRWTRQHCENIECIFLTSHADFKYVQEAIKMGGFDYVLQPVRYSEMEAVILKVYDRISQQKKLQQIVDVQKKTLKQKDAILDAILLKCASGKMEEADQIYRHFCEMFLPEYHHCVVYCVLVQVLKWKKITRPWNEKLVKLVLKNVLEEVFISQRAEVGISGQQRNYYWVFLVVERELLNSEIYEKNIETFYQFINQHLDFFIALYPMLRNTEDIFSDTYLSLFNRASANHQNKSGIYKYDVKTVTMQEEKPIELAIQYVKKNINRNFSRADVADYVHLNEEYFSRLFKQQTGDTFQDYVMFEKMEEAKKLLVHSKLSVSIIASKVGYGNFSHFSKMFKRATNQTPQEFRKVHQSCGESHKH